MNGNTNTGANARKRSESLENLLYSITIGFFVFVAFYKPGQDSLFTAFLLMFPVLLGILFVVKKMRHSGPNTRYLRIFLSAVSLNTLLLGVVHIVYHQPSWVNDNSHSLLKFVPLIFVAITILMLVWAVSHLLIYGGPNSTKEQGRSGRVNIADAVRTHPVEAMATAFAMFLFVTYFLAYAVGFDDRKGMSGVPALVGEWNSTIPRSADKKGDGKASETEFGRSSPGQTDSEPSCEKTDPVCTVVFSFKDGTKIPLLSNDGLSNDLACLEFLEGWKKTLDESSDDEVRMIAENSVARCRLIDFILEKTQQEKRIELELISIPTGTGNKNKSKEYAEVRAEAIRTRFKWMQDILGRSDPLLGIEKTIKNSGDGYHMPRVRAVAKVGEWPSFVHRKVEELGATMSGVNSQLTRIEEKIGNLNLSPGNEGQKDQLPRKRPGRPLMDYLYFMIYTTTTTGYGDLRPSSTFAKFTVSVANIIEVFFVVVFFNLVIAALRRFGEDSTD